MVTTATELLPVPETAQLDVDIKSAAYNVMPNQACHLFQASCQRNTATY